MIKIWCESCSGSGKIEIWYSQTDAFPKPCYDCNGKGYTEHKGSLEDLELAAAVKSLFNHVLKPSLVLELAEIENAEELISWHEEQKGNNNKNNI